MHKVNNLQCIKSKFYCNNDVIVYYYYLHYYKKLLTVFEIHEKHFLEYDLPQMQK